MYMQKSFKRILQFEHQIKLTMFFTPVKCCYKHEKSLINGAVVGLFT